MRHAMREDLKRICSDSGGDIERGEHERAGELIWIFGITGSRGWIGQEMFFRAEGVYIVGYVGKSDDIVYHHISPHTIDLPVVKVQMSV